MARLSDHIKNLSPSCFGMVMATGIVSVGMYFFGFGALSRVLFHLNCVVYVVLWLLTLARLSIVPMQVFADARDHLRGVGFFTMVAATSILGIQFVLLTDRADIASRFLVGALLLWLVLTYGIFTALTVGREKPSLREGISGGWLLAVVATQSLAVLAALLAGRARQPLHLELNFFALSMWLWGGMLYIWIMTLIFYRYTFFQFSPGDLTPPYWINMGAMAISTMAGSLLILNAPDVLFLSSLLPFLKGFTILYWATGTWWIPMLVILFVWRHGWRRFSLKYDPLYWGAVFPLGMYAVATHQMIDAMQLEFLGRLPFVFVWIGLIAWVIVFTGLLKKLGVILFFGRRTF